MNIKSSYQIERLQIEHAEHVSNKIWELWTKTGNWNEERIHWFYQNNAYGFPLTWTIRSDLSDYPLGCASVFKRNFIINGRTVPGGINCDFLIHPMHRTLGPAVQLLRKLVSEYNSFGIRFLMAYPSKAALPAFKRCGFKEVGHISRWTKMLLTRSYFEKCYGEKNVLSKISPFLDLMLFIASYDVWNRKLKKGKIAIRRAKVEDIKDLFSNIIDPVGFIGQRSIEYIKWRYSIPKIPPYDISLVYANKKVCGYCCYFVFDNIFYIEDLFLNSVSVKTSDVLSSILGLARSKNVTSINFGIMGCLGIEAALRKLGFSNREQRSLLIHTEDNLLFDDLKKQEYWYLMEGDVDL